MRDKILIDGRLIGYRRGGIANYALRLAEHIPGIAAEMDVQVLTRHDIACLADRSRHAFTPPHHRFERLTLGLEALAGRPSLFHATDYVDPILPGVRSIVTVHDLAFMNRPELLTGSSLRFYRNVVDSVRYADRVIAVSDWTRSQITSLLRVPEERIRVVPNGYDPALFHTDTTGDRWHLRGLHPDLLTIADSPSPLVLAVGTIEPRKQLGVLIETFEHIDQYIDGRSTPLPVLAVVGQAGWLADREIERLRALQRAGRARWLRDVNDRELAAIYRQASLLAMPSADEGFGLPVLEAMACGTPALVSANGALPELVSDVGFIEESDDPKRWGQKIAAILSDDEIRARRSRRGLDRASAYSWRETARQTVEVYREVLNQR